jgi:hypothetical protein
MAVTNKCLAQRNKTELAVTATKRWKPPNGRYRGVGALTTRRKWEMLRKAILLGSAAVVALSISARAQQTEYQDDPWAEDVKEWECSFAKEIPAKPDKDPVYKTELFLTYREMNKRTDTFPLKTFNVRHTTISGMPYQRSDQYIGITVSQIVARNEKSGTKIWSGYNAKNPRVKIVGELKWVEVGKAFESGFVPMKATYTEYFYRDNELVSTVTSKCHWTGPTC